jgi:hypothetical protein
MHEHVEATVGVARHEVAGQRAECDIAAWAPVLNTLTRVVEPCPSAVTPAPAVSAEATISNPTSAAIAVRGDLELLTMTPCSFRI